MILMPGTIQGITESRSVFVDGDLLLPNRSQGVYNHSPDGFNWGYGGSGPSQLALAIMLEFVDEDMAISLYQDFKVDVISKLSQDKDFEIDMETVELWIISHK
jgi:hypothetical protein